MLIIEHRVNHISELIAVPKAHGVEIDVRHDNRTGQLYLNHDPGAGEILEEYLTGFRHAFIIFNIKETGIEQRCIDLAARFRIEKSRYFLLDVEHPYLYRASRAGVREVAVRYSEDEPIEQALLYKGKVDWVWIDTNTTLPLDRGIIAQLAGFKTCLVSPEPWGRPQDIAVYQTKMKELNFFPDAVMTKKQYISLWERWEK